MSWFRNFTCVLLFLAGLPAAHAQSAWGTGMFGAQQTCPYELQFGDEATSMMDDIQERRELLAEKRKELEEEKAELKELRRDVRDFAKDFRVFGYSGEVFGFVQGFISQRGGRNCPNPSAPPRTATPAGPVTSGPGTPAVTSGAALDNAPGGITTEQWQVYCRAGTTRISGSFCRASEPNVEKDRTPRTYDRARCEDILEKWQNKAREFDQKEAKIAALDAEVKALRSDNERDTRAFRRASNRHQRELQRQMAEGECLDCLVAGPGQILRPRRPGALEIAGQFGLGALGIYAGTRLNQTISDNMASLGAPYTAPPAILAGLPSILNGVYGAIGAGVGRGGFGCMPGTGGAYGMGPQGMTNPWGMMNPMAMGGMPGGGAFGYPQNLFGNPMGGGIFLPGFGANGMNGPWGLGGGLGGGLGLCIQAPCPQGGGWAMPAMAMMPMMPMMTAMPAASGSIGMMMPGYMMPAMSGGSFMPAMAGGLAMGGMGMMPAMGGMGMMPAMGGAGMMPAMGGMGMMPAMGGMGMMPAMGGMGMMPAMGGMGMMPAMGGAGMMPAMGGAGMMPAMGGMGMMPAMGGMGMMPAMGGMGGMDPGMMQMQMQMQQMQMQMQMAQQQQLMDMQRRRYENYMAQSRVISGLEMEAQSIFMRLNQARMSLMSGGTVGFEAGFVSGPSQPGWNPGLGGPNFPGSGGFPPNNPGGLPPIGPGTNRGPPLR